MTRIKSEAIALIDGGQGIAADRAKPIILPTELKRALREHKKAGTRFKGLRRGLQREYAEYISNAKRADAKQRRIDKIVPMISAGVGLNDKYRH